MNFNGCVSNKKLNLIDCYALYILRCAFIAYG